MDKVSERTITRLVKYRCTLEDLAESGTTAVCSHDLARLLGLTPAQVRRDLMSIGYSGSARKGYDVFELRRSIADYLNSDRSVAMALIGIGMMGRALLAHFARKRHRFVAAFDCDPEKVNRVLLGVRCYPITDLRRVTQDERIQLATIAVPASQAQAVANEALLAGIRGFINLAPVTLRLPADAFVDTIDVAVAVEKVAFFTGRNQITREAGEPALV